MRKPNAADRWRRVREIFDAVADLGPAAREQALDAHCARDPELRREVAALLAHDRSADDPLDQIVALAAAEAVEVPEPASLLLLGAGLVGLGAKGRRRLRAPRP